MDDAGGLEISAQCGVSAHLLDDFRDAAEESPVVESWLADLDAIARQLTCLAGESGSVRQGSHWHWPVVGGHTAEAVTRDQCGPRPKLRRPQRGHYAGWAGSDHQYMHRGVRSD